MELIVEYRHTYPQLSNNFEVDIDHIDCLISTKKAIHIGLIISEVILNSIKYASSATKNYMIRIGLKQVNKNTISLTIGDNGKGFDFVEETTKSNLGLPLIKDLIEQLEFKATFPTKKNCYYDFQFEIDK